MTKLFLIIAAGYGFTGVVIGAFGAHALKSRFTPQNLSSWETAVQYQFVHALALLLVGLWLLHARSSGMQPESVLLWSGWAFALGVLLFSGSIYLLVLTQASWLGPITPIGGVFFLVGWACLFVAAVKTATS